MFQHHAYVTHVAIMVVFILLVWSIAFGVMGMDLVGVMPMVQGFVRCDAGSLWLVIIPKSKDRFMEQAADCPLVS
jgi:DMSO/TMAO reductase YedYZ heme-binding membrane subunit